MALKIMPLPIRIRIFLLSREEFGLCVKKDAKDQVFIDIFGGGYEFDIKIPETRKWILKIGGLEFFLEGRQMSDFTDDSAFLMLGKSA